ncbi:MAG: PAS domain S-box protein [Candidatus Hydrogenedentes bacterium]|nr:PAS domain S-box protein [Candidatus Hydrogenedentota bacterium]
MEPADQGSGVPYSGDAERRLRVLFDGIPVLAGSAEPDGSLEYVNRAWLEYTGLSSESALGSGWQDTIHPEDLPNFLRVWEEKRLAGAFWELEARMRRADGVYRWFLYRTNPLRDEQGKLLKWFGTATDIDDRKRAEALLQIREQEFRAFVENTPDLVIRYDRAFRRTYVNPAVSRTFGIPAEAFEGQCLGAISGEETNETESGRIHRLVRGVFETGVPVEYEMNWVIGQHRRTFSCRLYPEIDCGGQAVAVMGIARDITDRRIAERRIAASRDELQRVTGRLAELDENARRRLARELHDRAGELLTGLSINLKMVGVNLPAGLHGRAHQHLDEATRQLEELAERVREVVFELRPVVLDDFGIVAALSSYAKRFEARTGVRTAVKAPVSPLPLYAETETAYFRIAQEALTNVARHAGATEAIISIEHAHGRVSMQIADNGKGFEMIGASPDCETWGLGLLTMQERARAVGAEFSLVSRPGQGTKAAVWSPASALHD